MPNPWDTQNIKPNLKTLSELGHGDKFRILPDGQVDRNRYFQALTRKDTDSISNQLDSISRLFHAAIELSKQGGEWANRMKGAEQPELFIARAEIQAALAPQRQRPSGAHPRPARARQPRGDHQHGPWYAAEVPGTDVRRGPLPGGERNVHRAIQE